MRTILKEKAYYPELSVIIPVFNAENTLQKCIDSVLKQRFVDYELIIVDDGSTDNTSSYCHAYTETDKRIKYYKKQNGGPYKARLFGVEQSQGEYVTFCDADDYYINNTVFNHIHQYIKDNTPDAIQFGYKRKFNHLSQSVSVVKKEIKKDKTAFLDQDYPVLLCSFFENSNLTTNVWNKVYKRQILQNLPAAESAENVFWGDDLIFNLFALENCSSMFFTPDILYVYKDNIGGTTQFSKKAMHDLEIIKEHQLAFIKKINPENKSELESTLFSETACWFAAWVKDAVNNVNDDELEQMITTSLKQPSFIQAREYYLNKNPLNWEAMELLRQGSAKEYITWAKNNIKNNKLFKDKLIKIYKSL